MLLQQTPRASWDNEIWESYGYEWRWDVIGCLLKRAEERAAEREQSRGPRTADMEGMSMFGRPRNEKLKLDPPGVPWLETPS